MRDGTILATLARRSNYEPGVCVSEQVWSKADLHVHSNHSDGLAKIPEILEYTANNTDLKVIAITDHNTIQGALFAKELEDIYGVEVIVGEEMSTTHGHIIGLFLTEEIPARLTPVETLRRIHEQGGIAIIPHPFSARGVFGPLGRGKFATSLGEIAFHALEVYNSVPYLGWANRLAAKMFTQGQGIAAVGGSDAHVLDAIGKGCTLFRGTSAADLRVSLEALETRAIAERNGLSMAIRYVLDIPRIRRRQAWNWERCKAVA